VRGWVSLCVCARRACMACTENGIDAQMITFSHTHRPRRTAQRALERLADLRVRMAAYLAGAGCGERLRNGVRIAVVGRPNVGKSSLMNYLVGREASIVADRPGTTRDVIEVTGDVGGYPVAFVDTAGIRHAPALDPVEVEGVRRAEAAAATADLRLCVQDAAAGPDTLCSAASPLGVAPCRCALAASSGARNGGGAKTVVVLNKMDLIADGGLAALHTPDALLAIVATARADPKGCGKRVGDDMTNSESDVPNDTSDGPVAISCTARIGMRELVARLQREVALLCGSGGAASGPVVQTRHRAHLADCIAGIDRVLDDPADVVVAAEELRIAAEQFGYITGRFNNEDVLDVVFKEFCIGK
jgi:tRNA modification GTPase